MRILLPGGPAFEAAADLFEQGAITCVEGAGQGAQGRAVALGHHLHHHRRGDETGQDQAVAWGGVSNLQALDVEALAPPHDTTQ